MAATEQAARRKSVKRIRKEAMLAEFGEMIADAQGVFVAEYKGVDVASFNELRRSVDAAGGQVRVVKNTVARRALGDDQRFAPLAEHLQGQLVYGASASAPELAKVLAGFAKQHEAFVVAGGAMEGAYYDADQVKRLAELPSREQLLGMLAGTLNAPIAKLARTLAEVPASFARAVAAVRDSRGE